MADATPAKKTATKRPARPASSRIEPYAKAQIRLDCLALAVRHHSADGSSAEDVEKTASKFIDVVFPDEAK